MRSSLDRGVHAASADPPKDGPDFYAAPPLQSITVEAARTPPSTAGNSQSPRTGADRHLIGGDTIQQPNLALRVRYLDLLRAELLDHGLVDLGARGAVVIQGNPG